MFVLKNNIEIIPRYFTFILDSSFHIVYYIHIPIGWMVVRSRKTKDHRRVYDFIFSLFRAPHSNTRASIGAREEQVSRPALFFCKTRNRPLFYFCNTQDRPCSIKGRSLFYAGNRLHFNQVLRPAQHILHESHIF